MKLLTTNNAKIMKGRGKGYMIFGLHLAPADVASTPTHSVNVCPFASNGCKEACLNTAGRGRFDPIQAARIRKTRWFYNDRPAFLDRLRREIRNAIKLTDSKGLTAVFRLNLTSDICWEKYGIPQAFPDVQFYDYTKFPRNTRKVPPNYHLTYSLSEEPSSWDRAKKYLIDGMSVATVFHKVPTQWRNYSVVDGDEDDLRFLDPPSHIVGLKAKGKAKLDTSGFVQ